MSTDLLTALEHTDPSWSRGPEEIERLSAELDMVNVVSTAHADEFRKLLSFLLAAELAAHGRLKSKSSIELRGYLDVLHGEMPLEAFKARFGLWKPWSARDLAVLKLNPLVIFCYLRMIKESGRS
jgi:hypothetical protein